MTQPGPHSLSDRLGNHETGREPPKEIDETAVVRLLVSLSSLSGVALLTLSGTDNSVPADPEPAAPNPHPFLAISNSKVGIVAGNASLVPNNVALGNGVTACGAGSAVPRRQSSTAGSSVYGSGDDARATEGIDTLG